MWNLQLTKTYILWGKGTYRAEHSTSSVANMKSNKDGSTVSYMLKKRRNATIEMALDLVKILRLVWSLAAPSEFLCMAEGGLLEILPKVYIRCAWFPTRSEPIWLLYHGGVWMCSVTDKNHTLPNTKFTLHSNCFPHSGIYMVSNTGVGVGLTPLPLGPSIEDKIQGTQRLRNLSRLYT